MSWREIMQRVLSPIRDLSPEVTRGGAYGAIEGRKPPSSIPHVGVDFNYPVGQTGINLTHPALRSPVAGIVTDARLGKYGRIAIRDANGFSHEILHTNGRFVSLGDPVVAGQLIGTMGNTGLGRKGQQHVHYQLRDRGGSIMDPSAFWDQQGPADSNPSPPAYVGEYKQYLRNIGVDAGNGFGDPARAASGSATPFVAPGGVESPGDQNSFNARFGTWASAPAGMSPSTARDGAESFGGRFGNWGSVPADESDDANPAIVRALKKYGRSATSDAPTPEAVAPSPARVPSSGSPNPSPMSPPSNSTPPDNSIERWIASLAGDDLDDPAKYSRLPIFSPFSRR